MSRDPRNARFFTWASLKWIVRNRAWTPWYLIRYWRFILLKILHPHIITEGFVFIGRRVELYARPGYGQLILGKWVHLGEENRLRVHEGTLRVGDKTVLGRDNTVNTYLDIEIGGSCVIADWVYICDFDHVFNDINVPIKDQGLIKSPVRIGPDCWIATKVTITRGTFIGPGCVLAANSVVRGEIPAGSVVGGVPGKVLKDRVEQYEAQAFQRDAIADIARKTQVAADQNRSQRD